MAGVYVLNQNTKRETGRTAQLTNIAAARAVSDIIRTTLGPRAMLKMILDATGSITLTNDGNAILREVDVSHPAAKSMIELSRTQDDEVGDGTTSVAVLGGELLRLSEIFMERNIHPTIVVAAYFRALTDALVFATECSEEIDVKDDAKVEEVVNSCLGTKFVSRYKSLMVKMAVKAVKTVMYEEAGKVVADFKLLAKVEKIPGGEVSDCEVLDGVMFEKDVVSAHMRRRVENPRVLLVDCPMEFIKGESTTNVEITKESDWQRLLEIEEEYVTKMCADIMAFKPDLVICEKGISDLAAHILAKNNVSCIRRLRKTDNLRVAKACGATIVSRTDEIKESDIGTHAGLFEITKIADHYFTYIKQCKDPKACTIILRGASKDVLNEVERNMLDAMCVARNVLISPRLVPGGGAIEMAVSRRLYARAATIEGVSQAPYLAVAESLEIIPRTLADNCGASVVRLMTELRAKHMANPKETFWGVDGDKGKIVDMRTLGVWDPLAVKKSTIRTAVEASAMLLRIDDVVSGLSSKKGGDGGGNGYNSDDMEL